MMFRNRRLKYVIKKRKKCIAITQIHVQLKRIFEFRFISKM
jgi:hypothetical protein